MKKYFSTSHAIHERMQKGLERSLNAIYKKERFHEKAAFSFCGASSCF